MIDKSTADGDFPELAPLRLLMLQLDFDGVRKLADEAQLRYEKNKNARGVAWCMYHKAEIAFEMGAFSLAETQSGAALGKFTAISDKHGQGWALCNIQRSLCLMGQPEASRLAGRRAINIFFALNLKDGIPVVQRWLGVAEQKLKNLPESRVLLYEAMHGFIRIASPARFLECLHDLSWLEIDAGHPGEALRLQQYLVRHPESPRWAVINVMPSLGRLLRQPQRLPELVGSVEEIIMKLF